MREAAKNLYTTLRVIRKSNYKSIAVCKIPKKGFGKIINDRLMRASKLSILKRENFHSKEFEKVLSSQNSIIKRSNHPSN